MPLFPDARANAPRLGRIQESESPDHRHRRGASQTNGAKTRLVCHRAQSGVKPRVKIAIPSRGLEATGQDAHSRGTGPTWSWTTSSSSFSPAELASVFT